MKRKLLCLLLSLAMVAGLPNIPGRTMAQESAGELQEDAGSTSKDVVGIPQTFREMTGDELIADMGAGWNLGNTMDGHTGFTPDELVWQHVTTTKRLIKKVHDLGFHTIRIPVTWGTMIDDENGYTINEAWMSRVQDIVDYCISQDMYTIINIHHDGVAKDGGWLNIDAEDQEALKTKFCTVWKNIATVFRDYDEHLIFESMNEVEGTKGTVPEQNQKIMALNQGFVDTVRATGSNNARRWLMVPGKFNYIDSICNTRNQFKMPEDTVKDRTILSVHVYTPWNFCGKEAASSKTYSVEKLQKTNEKELEPLYNTYTSKGIPVVVGEYGCINKDNMTERAFYLEGMNRLFRKFHLVGVYWDQGWYDRSQTPDYSFTIIDRNTGNPVEKEVTDAIMRGYFGGSEDCSTLTKEVAVEPMTDIVPSETEVTLPIGERSKINVSCLPETSNDIVLWSSQDESVASVAYGEIHARGIGTTTVTAFSQSGSVSKEIKVTVTAASETPNLTIEPVKTDYVLTEGQSQHLQLQVTPAQEEGKIYYRSSNENVVTVSSVGKLVAVGVGSAQVSICSWGGQEVKVKVRVKGADVVEETRLSVNVYYNDSTHNYFANEISSDVITVKEPGQYELTFDCERDLSKAATGAGVESLSRLTAIYIKDYDVATGKFKKSAMTSCQIRYDKIIVDDVELTIKDNKFKSALKDSGIFDTNDPINAWDGSAVEEVKNQGNAVSFSTVTNPKRISITFTLADVSFEPPEPSAEPSLPATDPPVPEESQVPQESQMPEQSQSPQQTAAASQIPAGPSSPQPSMPAASQSPDVVAPPPDVQKPPVKDKEAKTYTGNKKIKKVVIGKDVTVIPKEAYKGCSSLKKIVVKSTVLKKVGKNALKGVHPKCKIKVPKKKLAAYKKLFRAKGQKKSVKLVS